MTDQGIISTTDQICLFDKHQDYLGLPVIPLAINKRLTLKYKRLKHHFGVLSWSSRTFQSEGTILLTDKLSGFS